MKQRNLIYIIVLMCIAIVCLVSVQYYWTQKAFKLNESSFTDSVRDAMNNVILWLDREDISYQLQNDRKQKKILSHIDSINMELRHLQENYPNIDFVPEQFQEEANGAFILEKDSAGEYRPLDKEALEQLLLEKQKSDLKKHKQLKTFYKKLKNERDNLIYGSRLVEDLYNEAMAKAPHLPITQRVNPYRLDTLVRAALYKKRIYTKVEWGIYSTFEEKWIVQKTGKYTKDLLKSKYYYLLYPNDREKRKYYLILDFPDKQNFILSQVWYLVLASILLFGLEIFVFSYTLRLVFRQKKLSELKDDFINHITHEIKTPISTISLICESFKDPEIHYDDLTTNNLIRTIQHESERLQSLSSQIIEISKLERGQYLLHKKAFSLHNAIEEAVANVHYQVSHQNGEIYCFLNATNDTIEGDYVHIVHIISNLIDNANKYSGGKAPLIAIYTQNIEGGIEVKVEDNGIGINKAHFKRIFEKLYRIPTGNTHNVKGFGLGLSYVKSIVDKHNGKIHLESEQKKGSIFSIFFSQN